MSRCAWVAVPAWVFPVWVTVDGDALGLDPLEDALWRLVGAGVDSDAALTAMLGLPSGLVASALASLATQHRVTLEGDRWRHQGDGSDVAECPAVTRSGWIAWDAASGRLCADLLLADDLIEGPEPHPDWTVYALDASPPSLGKPAARDIDEALRLVAGAGVLRVYDAGALGLEEVDARRVRRLRRKLDGRAQRRQLWSPIEHRVAGSVVWRGCLVPTPDHEAELDPGGWEGLLQRIPPDVRVAVLADQAEVVETVAPGVLREAGYASARDLREHARREALRALDATERDPAELVDVVTEAYISERLADAVGATWRALGRGWAGVIEAAVATIYQRVYPVV